MSVREATLAALQALGTGAATSAARAARDWPSVFRVIGMRPTSACGQPMLWHIATRKGTACHS